MDNFLLKILYIHNLCIHLCYVNLKQMKGLSIVGSSRNNGERESDDFYPTPPYAVEELLKQLEDD